MGVVQAIGTKITMKNAISTAFSTLLIALIVAIESDGNGKVTLYISVIPWLFLGWLILTLIDKIPSIVNHFVKLKIIGKASTPAQSSELFKSLFDPVRPPDAIQ